MWMVLCAPTLTLRFVVVSLLHPPSSSSESFPNFVVFFLVLFTTPELSFGSRVLKVVKKRNLSLSFSPVDLIVYECANASCLFCPIQAVQ